MGEKREKNVVAAVESVEKWATCFLLSTFQQTDGAEKGGKEQKISTNPTTKAPSMKYVGNGDRKRMKGTSERKSYSSRFRSGMRARTSSVGAMRLGRPLRTMRVRWLPTPRRKRPYLTNCWRVIPRRAFSSIR